MQAFKDWLSQPFQQGMSVQRWFAFVGFIIACMIIWSMILRRMEAV